MLASLSSKAFLGINVYYLLPLPQICMFGVLAEEGYYVGPFKSVIYHLDMLVNLDHF